MNGVVPGWSTRKVADFDCLNAGERMVSEGYRLSTVPGWVALFAEQRRDCIEVGGPPDCNWKIPVDAFCRVSLQ